MVVFAVRLANNKLMTAAACCNPLDLNTPKRIRTKRAIAIATNRLKRYRLALMIPPQLDLNKPISEQRKIVWDYLREHLLRYKQHNMGLRRYQGDPEKSEFHKWLGKFVKHYER